MHRARNYLLEIIAHKKDQSFPDMTVPKIIRNNFEDFCMDFQDAARRQVVLSVILIDYFLRPNNTGKYDAVWNSR